MCNELKPLNNFYNRKASEDGKGYRCKNCDDLARKQYQEKHRDKQSLMARKRMLRHKYHIELEDYNKLLEKQNYVCAICNGGPVATKPPFNSCLVVDHNHKTNNIRGLLCQKCNKALGLFKDNIENLKQAIKYLKKENL